MASEGADAASEAAAPYAVFHSAAVSVKSEVTDGMEVAASVRFLQHSLRLKLTLEPSEMEPLFSGAAWAGTTLWPASILLCEHLVLGFATGIFAEGQKMLELGAGLGAPGFCASLLGADVVLTEQDQLVRLLEENAACNFSGDSAPRVRCLDWSADAAASLAAEVLEKPEVGWDVVLASDVVYEPLYGDSWKLLSDCLEALLLNTSTVALLTAERRTGDNIDSFLDRLEGAGIAHRVLRKEAGDKLLLFELRSAKPRCLAEQEREEAQETSPR
mmetsp:Transcript_18453/g.69824  ORF Transcript_18453/g.69824 Transcript_18453/m.69824 type:complete len:273 (-) Transcript_18453:325-1143(-)